MYLLFTCHKDLQSQATCSAPACDISINNMMRQEAKFSKPNYYVVSTQMILHQLCGLLTMFVWVIGNKTVVPADDSTAADGEKPTSCL